MESRIETFAHLMDAEIFAGLLRDHDIPARVENTHPLTAQALWGQALGDFRIMVPNAHALTARGLLSRWRNGEFTLDEDAPESARDASSSR